MTAEQRYAHCKTIAELNHEYELNKMSADTFEYLNACEYAYSKRYAELKQKQNGEQDAVD